jgi:recombination protein RecA
MISALAREHPGGVANHTPPSQARHRASQTGQQPAPTREEQIVIPTGFPSLDRILGIGGLPKGRISEILGRPESGKTILALKVLAQAQADGRAAYINLSGSFDRGHVCRCGVDLSRLTLGEPRDLEEALTMAEAAVRTGGPAALILDATNTLWVGSDATRCMAAFLRRLAAPLAHARTAFLVVSSLNGLPGFATFADVRLQVTRRRWIEQEGVVQGCQADVQVLKNCFAPPGGSAVVSMWFDERVAARISANELGTHPSGCKRTPR